MSFAMLGTKIRQIRIHEWNKHIQDYKDQRHTTLSYGRLYDLKTRGKVSLPRGTKRELASAYFQLKIGHGYNKSYLARVDNSGSNTCRCGFPETPVHLLMYCNWYNEARARMKQKYFENTPLALRVLMETLIGAKAILSFIRETGISTRNWHLQRREGDEEGARDSEG